MDTKIQTSWGTIGWVCAAALVLFLLVAQRVTPVVFGAIESRLARVTPNPCIDAQIAMERAVARWALENGKHAGAQATANDLLGNGKYLIAAPTCPAGPGGSAAITVPPVGADAVCPNGLAGHDRVELALAAQSQAARMRNNCLIVGFLILFVVLEVVTAVVLWAREGVCGIACIQAQWDMQSAVATWAWVGGKSAGDRPTHKDLANLGGPPVAPPSCSSGPYCPTPIAIPAVGERAVCPHGLLAHDQTQASRGAEFTRRLRRSPLGLLYRLLRPRAQGAGAAFGDH